MTLLLSVPCLVAFLLVPELIMRALFSRGAFTGADAAAAGRTLSAYAIGLLPFVLMRSVSVTFLSRGDTTTPVKALFMAVAVNVALKVLLMDRYAQVGLAFATSIGAWINLLLLTWFGLRQGLIEFDRRLRRSALSLAVAGVVLALALYAGARACGLLFADWTALRDELTLIVLVAIGAVTYGAAIAVLFGRQVLAMLRGRSAPPPPAASR
jgi:putative peptidoglycan lipid II flippase